MSFIKKLFSLNPVFISGNIPELEGYYLFKQINGKYDFGYWLSKDFKGNNCRWLISCKQEDITEYSLVEPVYRGTAPYDIGGPYKDIDWRKVK